MENNLFFGFAKKVQKFQKWPKISKRIEKVKSGLFSLVAQNRPSEGPEGPDPGFLGGMSRGLGETRQKPVSFSPFFQFWTFWNFLDQFFQFWLFLIFSNFFEKTEKTEKRAKTKNNFRKIIFWFFPSFVSVRGFCENGPFRTFPGKTGFSLFAKLRFFRKLINFRKCFSRSFNICFLRKLKKPKIHFLQKIKTGSKKSKMAKTEKTGKMGPQKSGFSEPAWLFRKMGFPEPDQSFPDVSRRFGDFWSKRLPRPKAHKKWSQKWIRFFPSSRTLTKVPGKNQIYFCGLMAPKRAQFFLRAGPASSPKKGPRTPLGSKNELKMGQNWTSKMSSVFSNSVDPADPIWTKPNPKVVNYYTQNRSIFPKWEKPFVSRP